MENIKRVTPEISISGQITPQELDDAAHAGYQAVLNLRSPSEEGFWSEEKAYVTGLGLHYVNAPVNLSELTEDLTDHVLSCIDEMPKPVLIHCGVSMRAGAMALMNIATRQGLTVEQAFEKAEEMGFECNAYPEVKKFFQSYVSQSSKTESNA